MCNTWQNPSKKKQEFSPELIERIPANLNFINITGGEPFLRDDLDQIIEIALKKTKRLVISTNGYFTKRILGMAKKGIGDRHFMLDTNKFMCNVGQKYSRKGAHHAQNPAIDHQ
jgi:MoaA/NifB/PqqE/SkfB family radical SAM enzyme